MKHQRSFLLSGIAACFLIGAAMSMPASAQNNRGGNIAEGEQIATKGAGNGVAACASCHGAHGEGMAASGFPRLVGQSEAYLAHQMHSLADGSRNHPIMTPIVKKLSESQREATAAYYASLPVTPAARQPAAKPAAPNVQNRGKQLATVGDNGKGVQACANCHGPGGIGMAPATPALAAQSSTYLVAALNEWQSGARNTDPSQQMPMIAKRLSNDDITAVAAYYASQPLPASTAERSNASSNATRKPAPSKPAAGPASNGGSAPVKGVGVGQGAATTGGQQGPGGGGGATGSGSQGGSGGTPH